MEKEADFPYRVDNYEIWKDIRIDISRLVRRCKHLDKIKRPVLPELPNEAYLVSADISPELNTLMEYIFYKKSLPDYLNPEIYIRYDPGSPSTMGYTSPCDLFPLGALYIDPNNKVHPKDDVYTLGEIAGVFEHELNHVAMNNSKAWEEKCRRHEELVLTYEKTLSKLKKRVSSADKIQSDVSPQERLSHLEDTLERFKFQIEQEEEKWADENSLFPQGLLTHLNRINAYLRTWNAEPIEEYFQNKGLIALNRKTQQAIKSLSEAVDLSGLASHRVAKKDPKKHYAELHDGEKTFTFRAKRSHPPINLRISKLNLQIAMKDTDESKNKGR